MNLDINNIREELNKNDNYVFRHSENKSTTYYVNKESGTQFKLNKRNKKVTILNNNGIKIKEKRIYTPKELERYGFKIQ